ncbi:hypothetical protein FB451DRAFT_1403209 [Mycena latifolia]|nr:hypothetical protein FB451DRAFT_1403209 [Mycena latifolia]
MLASEPITLSAPPRRHSPAPLAQQRLRSASERHPSPASSHPAPALNRRHSLNFMRKPLRSSPLAGPAMSSDGTSEEDAPAARPARTFSTPDLPSLSRLSPAPAKSPAPAPAPPAPSTPAALAPPRTVSKRASLMEMVKRPLALRSPPPPIPLPAPPSSASAAGASPSSVIYTPLPPPPLSPRHHSRTRPRSRGSISTPASMTNMPASMSLNDLSASFPLPPPSFPRALTAPSTSRRSATLPLPPARAATPVYGAPHDSGDSWLTSLPFGDTPRFSRLALAAPNVVLPVSARAARRTSMRGEGGKRVSLVCAPVLAPSRSSSLVHPMAAAPEYFASTPSLLTRSRSRSLSSEGPTTPSAASSVFGADSVSVGGAEDDDEFALDGALEVDIALVSPRDFEAGAYAAQDAESEDPHGLRKPASVHAPSLAPARSTWSLSIGHRRSHAHAKGTSFLSFGSGDSSSTTSVSVFSPVHSPAPSYAPAQSATPAVRVELSPYDAALAAYSPSEADGASQKGGADGGGKLPKAAGTMRRILRSLSGVGRRAN